MAFASSPGSVDGAPRNARGCQKYRCSSGKWRTTENCSPSTSRMNTGADLNPIEEAEAYQILIGDHGLGQEDVGRLVGKTRAAVANTVRLLRLNERVQEMVRSGALSAGQARPLLSLETEAEQLVLAERAIAEGLTARRLEQLASPRKKKKARREEKDPDTRAAEEKLERKLQTKVEIRRSGAGGTVALHFHSEEELMGLFDMLMSAAEER